MATMKQNCEIKDLVNEYAARERETCNQIIDRNIKKVERGGQVSILDFYPEFDLEHPYTSKRFDPFSRLQNVPVWALLPYYANIIVHIHPYLSEREFKKIYGVNIDQLLNLQDDKKISLVLEAPFNYDENISDYFIPLYEENVHGKLKLPTFSRIGAFGYFVGGQVYEDAFEDGWDLFENKLDDVISYLCKADNIRQTGDVQEDFVENARLSYANLKGLGFHQIADDIKTLATLNPVSAYCRLSVYSQFLIKPRIGSFDGIHLVDKEELPTDKYCEELGLNWNATNTECEVYPAEVGKSLIKNAKLVTSNNLENALDVYPDFEKARNALKNLETALEQKIGDLEKRDQIIDKKTALEEVWKDVNTIEKNKRNVKTILVTLGVVDATMLGGYLGGFPGILAGLVGSLASSDVVAGPLSEKIAKFGKSNHIVEVFDFVRDVKQE